VHRAVTANRHDVARAVLRGPVGELGPMPGTSGARDINRPALGPEGTDDSVLDLPAGAVPRRRIDDDVRVNQTYSIG
jgi:hypothetical protein